MESITKEQIPDYAPCVVQLPQGWSAEVRTEHDSDMEAPWEEHDGHGPVSGLVRRDKRPGERVLQAESRVAIYYDFAEAVRIAKRDGWLCGNPSHSHATKDGVYVKRGELAACAVKADFQRLRAWCRGEWEWIGVLVTVRDASGEEVDSGSVWGIESDTDYWREVAAELIQELAAGYVLPNVGSVAACTCEYDGRKCLVHGTLPNIAGRAK